MIIAQKLADKLHITKMKANGFTASIDDGSLKPVGICWMTQPKGVFCLATASTSS